MPLTRKSKAAKQKIAIELRLFAISDVIDDHIYQGKLISVQEAVGYTNEIAGFKVKCFGDARLLQVIDKISQHMKRIINEQESSYQTDASHSTDNGTNIDQSPVYSLSDVDVTASTHDFTKDTKTNPKATQNIPSSTQNIPKFMQNIMLKSTQNITKAAQNDHFEVKDNNNFHGNTKNINSKNYISIKSNTDSNEYKIIPGDIKKYIKSKNNTAVNQRTINKTIDQEVIDLCDDEDEMNNAFSALSLKGPAPMTIDFQCSQSLLEDYTQDNATSMPEIGNEIKGNENFKESKLINPIVPEQCLKNQRDYLRTELCDVNNSNKENSNIRPNETEVSDSKMKKTRKRKTKIDDFLVDINQNKFRKTINNIDTISEIPKKKRNKRQTKTTTKKTKNKSKTNDDEKIAMTKDIRSYFSLSKNNECKPLDKSMGSVSDYSVSKATTVKNTFTPEKPSIYTTNVFDDLSWMENLRFVKEVATDEFDPNFSCLEDTFWHNSVVPFLDDQDFTV